MSNRPIAPIFTGDENEQFAELVYSFLKGVAKYHFAQHTVSAIPEEMEPNVFKEDAAARRKHDTAALLDRFGLDVNKPEESIDGWFDDKTNQHIARLLSDMRAAVEDRCAAMVDVTNPQSYARLVIATETLATYYRIFRERYGVWLHPAP